jgi:GAF domain-containing protein
MSEPALPVGSGPPLAFALQELAELLLATDSFQDLMQRIAELSVRSVHGVLTCGITMANGGRVITVASADPLGALLDEQQYEIDEGPCLEALYTARIVTAPDMSRESRWHGYPRQAMAHGVSAVYSSPLIIRGEALGVLNLYAAQVGAFEDLDRVELIAQIVTLTCVAITATLRNYGDVTLAEQLQTAMSSRSVIDQAMGIVMATEHCTAADAFALLRGISQTRNVRLADIAKDLVARTAAGSR